MEPFVSSVFFPFSVMWKFVYIGTCISINALLWLNNFPLHSYIIIYLSKNMDIQAVFIFWLLEILLL